jgi:hypothetical protein
MYIRVNVPLNLTALYDQADLFTTYLHTLKNTTSSTYKIIPLTKAVRDTGDFALRLYWLTTALHSPFIDTFSALELQNKRELNWVRNNIKKESKLGQLGQGQSKDFMQK